MAEKLTPTADGALRDGFGSIYRLASEPYTCPLKNRVIPLNTASPQDDEGMQGSKEATLTVPRYG